MLRAAFLALPLVLVPVPAMSVAAGAAEIQSATGEQCQRRGQGRRRGGAALGMIGRGLLGRFGGGAANLILPMGSVLGDAIMNLLDCDEQERAASATERSVERAERGGAGTSTSWQSETRPNVSGSSTVTAVEADAADGQCMTVTDIVIIDGEETRAPKRMCKRPPNNRYVRVV